MNRAYVLVLCACAGLTTFARAAHTENAPNQACPAAALVTPDYDACAPVHDATPMVSVGAAERALELPSLRALRHGDAPQIGTSARSIAPPPPGGIGSGTTYKAGTLSARSHAELHTTMFVYPDGVDPSAAGLSWLFTTATNRTQKGVEVVGIYLEDGPGSLGIFDWSCSTADPCMGGRADPAWIVTIGLRDLECDISEIVDQGGHVQHVMRYANQTLKLDEAAPPLWRNAVFLWNRCDSAWDLIYQHEYRVAQPDCSVTGCGWWGPILETFSNNLPLINELGFEDTLLLHDGTWSELRPDETNFARPVPVWTLFHLDPNRGYGVGNRTQDLVSVVIDIKPGSDENSINPRSRGVIPVAVLGTDLFDATQVDVSTLAFGPGGAAEAHGRVHVGDIDGDGDADVVLHFRTQEAGIRCGDTAAELTGTTFDGLRFAGADSLAAVACKGRAR